jgi:hypothetical protein
LAVQVAGRVSNQRSINFSGKAIFWDKPDASIQLLCQRLIGSTIPEGSRAAPSVA